MKLLNGTEMAGFIKERQSKQVRQLTTANNKGPRLVIIQTLDDPVINTYVKLKQIYGSDIGVVVDVYKVSQVEAQDLITRLNDDGQVTGIIVQLPLENPKQTEAILNMVKPEKDVDGLGKGSLFNPATPTAISWLLMGNNIDLRGKKVAIIGKGPLVGAPLAKALQNSGVDVTAADRATPSLKEVTLAADVIVAATGVPGLVTSDLVPRGAVIVDAGVASASGKTAGDVSEDVYKRDDISITPKKGGVGPLTVCALFENVIVAAGR